MLTTRHNIHHSKLPKPGEVVRIYGLGRNGYDSREKWRVESFPLNDNVSPWSRGVHTVNLRRLRDGKPARVSGFYCFDPSDI